MEKEFRKRCEGVVEVNAGKDSDDNKRDERDKGRDEEEGGQVGQRKEGNVRVRVERLEEEMRRRREREKRGKSDGPYAYRKERIGWKKEVKES